MTDPMPDDLAAPGRDLRAYTDELRPKCPVVKNSAGDWVLLQHAEVVQAALNHEQFSSNVSRHLQIPNGLDGAEHTQYRELIDRYLTREALTPYVPTFERIAGQLIDELPRGKPVDAVHDIGAVFAVRAQCAWLGWPTQLEPELLAWMSANHEATRSGEHGKMARVADIFDDIIRSVIAPRRAAGDKAPDDVTTQLCRETLNGRLLSEAELVSILRNWTGGDLSSIALCIGVIVEYLVRHPEYREHLRCATDTELEAAIDEILRLDNPFISNRRITTCPVNIGGQQIPSGATVKLNWTSANRDETVFNHNAFDPVAHAGDNLVYGIGKHVCPGRLLATWQLRITLRALLAGVSTLSFAPDQSVERETAPVGGFHKVPIILT